MLLQCRKVSGIESPSTAEDSESHRRRLLNAMKEFASTITLPEIIDALPKEKEKARKCSLRLSPGTSGWTILLSVYLFSHQFETQELRQVDVVKAVEILSRVSKSNGVKLSCLSAAGINPTLPTRRCVHAVRPPLQGIQLESGFVSS